MNSFNRNPLHTLFASSCLLANLAGKASQLKQTHELTWNFSGFRDGEVNWENEIHYGDSIRILCPTKKDRVGLGLQSFTLYFITNSQEDDCRYKEKYWDFVYTCDLSADDDNPNVYVFNVKKAYLPGTRTFVEGERYTLVAMENLPPYTDMSPKHEHGQLSNLCRDYNMRLHFLVNRVGSSTGEDEVQESNNNGDLRPPPAEISPLPDNGFKEQPYDETDVEIESMDDFRDVLPALIAIILVLVLLALGSTYFLCCRGRRSQPKNSNHSAHSTIDTTYGIREQQQWLQTSVKPEIPVQVAPIRAGAAPHGLKPATSFDQLRMMSHTPSTLQNPTIGTIVGGNLENTTISTSLKYKRASPSGQMYRNPNQTQFFRTHEEVYPDSYSKPLLRAVQPIEIAGNSSNVRCPVSPNDTGCETGASNDGSIPPGTTVLI